MSKTPLHTRMDQQNIGQTRMSELADVSLAEMDYLMRGKRIPQLPLAHRIARLLGSTIDELWPAEYVGAFDDVPIPPLRRAQRCQRKVN